MVSSISLFDFVFFGFLPTVIKVRLRSETPINLGMTPFLSTPMVDFPKCHGMLDWREVGEEDRKPAPGSLSSRSKI